MDVLAAVKEKENYEKIVTWFRLQGTLTTEQLVLLADTIEAMSEEIFEHYKALQEICRGEMKSIRDKYETQADMLETLSVTEKKALYHAMKKACTIGVLLTERYEVLIKALEDYI